MAKYSGVILRWAHQSEAFKLFDPSTVGTTRYRYRGAAIPTPWATTG